MKEITLTEQELDDLKDTIKFREKVVYQLKQLNNIPKKVWKLEVWSKVQWFTLSGILLFIIIRVMGLWNGK